MYSACRWNASIASDEAIVYSLIDSINEYLCVYRSCSCNRSINLLWLCNPQLDWMDTKVWMRCFVNTSLDIHDSSLADSISINLFHIFLSRNLIGVFFYEYISNTLDIVDTCSNDNYALNGMPPFVIVTVYCKCNKLCNSNIFDSAMIIIFVQENYIIVKWIHPAFKLHFV